MDVTEGTMEKSLLNGDCKTLSSPEGCPNTWKYVDENFEWKIDIELKVECGRL